MRCVEFKMATCQTELNKYYEDQNSIIVGGYTLKPGTPANKKNVFSTNRTLVNDLESKPRAGMQKLISNLKETTYLRPLL